MITIPAGSRVMIIITKEEEEVPITMINDFIATNSWAKDAFLTFLFLDSYWHKIGGISAAYTGFIAIKSPEKKLGVPKFTRLKTDSPEFLSAIEALAQFLDREENRNRTVLNFHERSYTQGEYHNFDWYICLI